MILRIKLILATIIYSPLLYLYRKSKNKGVIDKDIERWCKELNIAESTTNKLVVLLMLFPQFRNLFYFRVRPRVKAVKRLCPEDKSLAIALDFNDIDGGVFSLSMPMLLI